MSSEALVSRVIETLGVEIAAALEAIALRPKQLPDDEEFLEYLRAMAEGQTPAEFFGYTEEQLLSIEQAALGLYRARRYQDAALFYVWLCDTNTTQASSAWRGLGACLQAVGAAGHAFLAYATASSQNRDDLISEALAGECRIIVGDTEAGHALLDDFLVKAQHDPSLSQTIARARAIKGLKASATYSEEEKNQQKWRHFSLLLPDGRRKPAGAAALLYADAVGAPTAKSLSGGGAPQENDQSSDAAGPFDEAALKELQETALRVFDSPEMSAQLAEISEAVQTGKLTRKDVGGITSEQMDAGYAVACQFINTQQVQAGLDLVAWLMWLDSTDPRFYHLAALCMHQMKVWPLAEALYGLSSLMGSALSATQVYQGECILMQAAPQRALEALEEGHARALQEGQAGAALAARSKLLIQTAKTMMQASGVQPATEA